MRHRLQRPNDPCRSSRCAATDFPSAAVDLNGARLWAFTACSSAALAVRTHHCLWQVQVERRPIVTR